MWPRIQAGRLLAQEPKSTLKAYRLLAANLVEEGHPKTLAQEIGIKSQRLVALQDLKVQVDARRCSQDRESFSTISSQLLKVEVDQDQVKR